MRVILWDKIDMAGVARKSVQRHYPIATCTPLYRRETYAEYALFWYSVGVENMSVHYMESWAWKVSTAYASETR